jgi:purine nucleosidase
MASAPRKIIIDTDPGVDDAMAILMALASPDLDIVGLTTIFGNAGIEVTTPNALTLLEVAGRSDIQVAKGATNPIATSYLGPVPQIHGHNGLGDMELTPPTGSLASENASEFIYGAVSAQPGKITLLALGPLTNLALALQAHPDIANLVDEVVVMGGNALVRGNATPTAEANINNDPEAADLVFGAAWKVTMVGLDVTHRVNMTPDHLAAITSGDSATARLLAGALPPYYRFFEGRLGIKGIYVHDPSTVAYLLDPSLFGTHAWPLRVETESFSRGKTWPNIGDTDDAAPLPWRGRPLVNLCTSVDAEGVVAMVTHLLSKGV